MKKRLCNKKISSSFCMCFDSVVLENNNGLVVGEKGEPLPPSEEDKEEVKPILSPAANMMVSSDDKNKDIVGFFRRKNKHCRWSFSRYVKAVFFETSLMKKMRNKKQGKNFSKPESKSTDNKIPSSSGIEDSTSTSMFSSCLCTNSATNSSSSSSTSTATSTCSSTSLSWSSRPRSSECTENNNVKEKVGNYIGSKGCKGFNVGFCLFLTSLLVLIIWGKVFAIFCTSTWLFFVYPWSSAKLAPSENNAVDHHFPEFFESELYKKKVIMEGLLRRNHSRNRLIEHSCLTNFRI